jgi:16S rRNA (cytidine1402-2'-O)-methyltransferase
LTDQDPKHRHEHVTIVPTVPEQPRSSLVTRVSVDLARLMAEPLEAGLYLVATPIGNLADISLRALTVLARADVIYCEDTRHSLTLTGHFGITTHLTPYHEHNGERERPKILSQLADGRRIALISDAGTPLISDPGYKLVREVVDAGHRVWSLPGASAPLTALTVSGLPTDAFFFAGFLPARSTARKTRAKELASVPATLIFFEAPSRMAEALADLAAVYGPRPAAVARELTKRFETVSRGTLTTLAAAFCAEDARGEYVIMVGPPLIVAVTDAMIADRLVTALETMSLRDASRAIAEDLSIPKSRVYDLAIKQRNDVP